MTKEQQVKELVEWVAEQIRPLAKNYVLGYIHNLNGLEPELKRVVDCYTTQILSHPDLALIDREVVLHRFTSLLLSPDYIAGIRRIQDAVIPLAEAIKKVKK